MQYFVYVLISQKDNKRYIGFTKDLERRLQRDNAGKVNSTKHRRPLKLISFKRFTVLEEAVSYEKRLKGKRWRA